ncbi:hypothetical protein BSG1_17325 [Bacillus sp. SG-1]|nr:hypothetical protein BSG1_17325 [Bacillus sp. SG-1]
MLGRKGSKRPNENEILERYWCEKGVNGPMRMKFWRDVGAKRE